MSLLLALVMLLGLVPGLPGEASAHWADSDLSQLVEWGFIRPDQAGYPDRALTRADFMAIVNRAYGYHEPGETPFVDVEEKDWFYDDVGVAYTARYIKGTSPTTASPNSTLTRETAATILGRNMMLQESVGEILDFTDARGISSWAKGTIKASLEHYLVSGYNDNTFRPQRAVSWGEMASMITRIVGTPIQEPGDYALGGVYGNVTITSPEVTLRDTVISGDLYVTGGVGLGGVTLENVTVLGRIIASGTGSSEGGQDSILLRNVVADELLVDNLQDHPVSVRADGITDIGRTTVRTSAYIEDNTPDGMGLKYISLEGESYPEGEEPEDWQPIQLDLAGRIGEVVNKTPQSQVRAAAGTVAKLTVDEAAVESTVIIDRGAVIKELDLDTATEVTGEGDIEKLVVNAPDCSVEMLPDQIVIRPGITADIAGEEMDSVGAQESSMEPMILAGYPQARDITPNGLEAVFSTNKSGTVYWAVSAVTDGSVGEEDLIKPPSYGNIALKNGSVKIPRGNEEISAKISGLTPGGSYYLSAILVDARGQRSAVKVISFTTPDNTKPAFCNGYPRRSKVSRTDSVVVVMPTKDCKLYYALLPEGAAAPTEDDLKTSSVSGALGYGVRDVTKNKEDAFRVNDTILDEVTNYVLYLWLTDGVNKSAIVKLTFKTDDETPPEFIVDPTPEKQTANSVSLKFQLSEPGTVYWVAFPYGSVENYPKPQHGTEYETAPLNSAYAIQQVVNGMNIGSEGKSGRVTVRANSDGACIGTFNITGMKPETTYEVYYVAKDNAGPDRNYSVTVKYITVSPKDDRGPVFVQSFELTVEGDKSRPRSGSDIYIDVSEDVYFQGQGGSKSLAELYKDTQTGSAASREQAVNRLAEVLSKSIVLHKYDENDNELTNFHSKNNTADTRTDWEIDYTQATVESRKEGGIRITFPSEGLQLQNGGWYCFIISKLQDLAGNSIEPEGIVNFWNGNTAELKKVGHDVPPFPMESPWVLMGSPKFDGQGPIIRDGDDAGKAARADMSFSLQPQSTSSVSGTTAYDIVLWSGTPMAYDLYYRVIDKATGKTFLEGGRYPAAAPDGSTDYLITQTGGKDVDQNGWIYLGNSKDLYPPSPTNEKEETWTGLSVSKDLLGCEDGNFGQLKNFNENLEYQFIIMLTMHRGKSLDEYTSWEKEAKINVNVISGQSQNLNRLALALDNNWDEFLELGGTQGAESIGRWRKDKESPYVKTQELRWTFTLQKPPAFETGNPKFIMNSDGTVSVDVSLDVSGDIHWAISEVQANGRAAYDTTRYLIPKTDDYAKDANGAYTNSPDVSVSIVPNTNDKQMFITAEGHRPPQIGGTTLERPMPDWMKGLDTKTEVIEDIDIINNSLDDPEKMNKITSPLNTTIIQKKFGNDGKMKDWDIHTYDTDAEPGSQEQLILDSVEPRKTYFAYFVTTPKGSNKYMSHVYIYQFTVPELARPQIGLTADRLTGDVTVTLDKETQLEWRAFSAYDAVSQTTISILTKPFSSFAEHKLPKAYEDYTVLDALRATYNFDTASRGDPSAKNPASSSYWYPDKGGDYFAYDDMEPGYSVFDMYASTETRRQLIRLISNGELNSPEMVDPATPSWSDDEHTPKIPSGTNTVSKNLENGKLLQDNTPFVFLTWAINWSSYNDADGVNSKAPNASFRAVEYTKGSLDAPEVDYADNGYLTQNSVSKKYSGQVHIRFENPVYRLVNGERVPLSSENLLDFLTDEEDRKHFSIKGNPTRYDFTLEFKDVGSGPMLSFPPDHFVNYSRIASSKNLSLRIGAGTGEYKGQTCLIVEWPGNPDSPWQFPLEEEDDSDGSTLLISGKDLGGSAGAQKTLTLNVGYTTPNDITAYFEPELNSPEFTWTIPDDSIIQFDGITGNKAESETIKIHAVQLGVVTVTLVAIGKDDNGRIQQEEGTIEVTVTGEIQTFSVASATGGILYTHPNLTISLGDPVPSVEFDVIVDNVTGSLSENVAFSIQKGGTNSNSVQCEEVDGHKIQITPANGAKAGHTAKVTVGLIDKETGKDLTPGAGAKKTINITFKDPDTTTYNNSDRTPNRLVPESLSFGNVSGAKLTGGVVKMSGNTMSSTIAAIINPSGAAGTIKWESSNPAIASVTPNGSRATITGLSTGTATIKASVVGTDVENSFAVTVTADISVNSFKANSDKSTITSTDGGYTWSQKSTSTGAAATLTFSAGLSLENAKITVTSSDPDAVKVGKVNKVDDKTRSVQLTYAYKNAKGEVTITVKVGDKTKTFKLKLEETGVLNIAKK